MSLSSIGRLQAATATQSIALRSSMRSSLWGGPQVLPVCYQEQGGVEGSWTPILGRAPYYAAWAYWKWNAGGLSGLIGMACRTGAAFFQNSSKLAIVCAGHNQGLLPPSSCTTDFDALIKSLAAAEFDIVFVSMPFMGDNQGFHNYSDPALSAVPSGGLHFAIGTGAVQGIGLIGSRLRYWIDPVIAGLQYAINSRSAIGQSLSTPQTYNRIVMVGHSGGGWTTTLCAAIDPRIDRSYSVAGSMPFAYRVANEPGLADWEQEDGFRGLGFNDYPDAYLMAAAESSRKHMLFYNGGDTSFTGHRAAPWAAWLRETAQDGGFGEVDVLIDHNAVGHNISPLVRAAIVADAIQT